MKVIQPVHIEYADVQSSIAEDATVLWASSEIYSKDNLVREGMYIYRSLKDGNTANTPSKTKWGPDAWWMVEHVTNRAAMFDDRLDTQTVAAEGDDTLTISVPWARMSGFALLNVDAISAHVRIVGAESSVLFERDYSLTEGANNWYDYYMRNWTMKHDLVDLLIPSMATGSFTLTLSGGRPAIGHLVIGQHENPGATLYGAVAELQNYSVRETDAYGNTSTVVRGSAKRYNCELYLHPRDADGVFNLLRDIKDAPCLWLGDNRVTADGGHESLTAYGYYRRASLAFSGPNDSRYNMEIEGVI